VFLAFYRDFLLADEEWRVETQKPDCSHTSEESNKDYLVLSQEYRPHRIQILKFSNLGKSSCQTKAPF
jgi:hypothetical protein